MKTTPYIIHCKLDYYSLCDFCALGATKHNGTGSEVLEKESEANLGPDVDKSPHSFLVQIKVLD